MKKIIVFLCILNFSGCAALIGIKEYESKGDYTRVSFVTGYGFESNVTATDTVDNKRGIRPSTASIQPAKY